MHGNPNKKVAAAIQLAHLLRERSYVECLNGGIGKYTESDEHCWQQACKDQELPDDLWYVLHLANHWCNDLQWWAEQVLAGKSLESRVPDVSSKTEINKDER